MVNGVYAFGFLFMLPQLFVNYKLKSVAALPWRAFMYKAFNTFIDDIFAFIITMPTAHRIACFRDDIVFIIYLVCIPYDLFCFKFKTGWFNFFDFNFYFIFSINVGCIPLIKVVWTTALENSPKICVNEIGSSSNVSNKMVGESMLEEVSNEGIFRIFFFSSNFYT